jgi:hypothetical protein
MGYSQFRSRSWLTALVSVTLLVASVALFVSDSQAAAGEPLPAQAQMYEQAGGEITPLMKALPADYPNWKGEYFANRRLKGKPALVRNDAKVDFDWGTGAPAPGLPADNFSVRWTQWIYFAAGTYRFCITADDGVSVEMDDKTPFIREWHDGAGTYCAQVPVTEGEHKVRVEYYEHGGQARVEFWWEQATWKGEYFANRKLRGRPVFARSDGKVDFNWGAGAAAADLPADNFSVRWTRRAYFVAGTYRFCAQVDDGVSVEMDDQRPFIREWHDGIGTYCANVQVTEGLHKVRVEYFEHLGEARIKVGWQRIQ